MLFNYCFFFFLNPLRISLSFVWFKQPIKVADVGFKMKLIMRLQDQLARSLSLSQKATISTKHPLHCNMNIALLCVKVYQRNTGKPLIFKEIQIGTKTFFLSSLPPGHYIYRRRRDVV